MKDDMNYILEKFPNFFDYYVNNEIIIFIKKIFIFYFLSIFYYV